MSISKVSMNQLCCRQHTSAVLMNACLPVPANSSVSYKGHIEHEHHAVTKKKHTDWNSDLQALHWAFFFLPSHSYLSPFPYLFLTYPNDLYPSPTVLDLCPYLCENHDHVLPCRDLYDYPFHFVLYLYLVYLFLFRLRYLQPHSHLHLHRNQVHQRQEHYRPYPCICFDYEGP